MGSAAEVDIIEQDDVYIEELDIYKDNPEVQEALRMLEKHGLVATLKPIQVNRQVQRRAEKKALDETIKNLTGKILHKYSVNYEGKSLDKKTHVKTNFEFIKSSIDNKTNQFLGIKSGQRADISLEQIQLAKRELERIVSEVESEVFGAQS
jgi:UPF0288 family protein (methanogenesis marker protein 3)